MASFSCVYPSECEVTIFTGALGVENPGMFKATREEAGSGNSLPLRLGASKDFFVRKSAENDMHL